VAISRVCEGATDRFRLRDRHLYSGVEKELRGLKHVHGALLAWQAEHGLPAPWRESVDPYACLIAAVMAQQTQMSRVMPSYERFMAAFPTLEALAGATPGAVIRAWAGMGYNRRAVRLHRAARQILEGGWPRRAADLAGIDGIGPFTAAIVASFAFGEGVGCVDTNVRRVLGRLVGDEAISGKPLQALANASVAAAEPGRWNQALMDYGALMCGVRPKCEACVVSAWCESRGRYASGELQVAERRGRYGASRRKREAPFAGSTRYYRGRIVDALRALPVDGSISISVLRTRIANNGSGPTVAEVRELVAALERHGLARVSRGRVSLPE